MPDLTCYRIRSSFFDGEPLTFEAVVDTGEKQVDAYGPVEGVDFLAMVFVTQTFPLPPPWAAFLRDGFDDIQLASRPSLGALLLVMIDDPDRMFAFPFGQAGRFLLRSDAVSRAYGVRTALNLISPSGSSDEAASRMRSVDTSDSTGRTPLRARKQTPREAPLEDFDVDQWREILRQVVGRPESKGHWGSRVLGGDQLSFGADLEFEDLGERCREIDRVAELLDYQERFDFVDNLQHVRAADVLEAVQQAVVSALQAGDPDAQFDLSPPDIMDWEQIRGFRFSFDKEQKKFNRPEIHLDHYILHSEIKDQISLDTLNADWLAAVDSDGKRVTRWTIWRCLSGSIDVDGKIYVLDDGAIYEVADIFMNELNEAIDRIEESCIALPYCKTGTEEETYNSETAAANAGLVCLDRKLVRVNRSTGVEVCDLLSKSGQLVHVKRHFWSATLSHLFNQGLVSGQMLLQSSDFRAEAIAKTVEVGAGSHDAVITSDGFRASDYEIVFAIVDDWKEKTLAERLPFFSSVTLRHVATTLELMGYSVTYRKVQTVAQP